MKSTLKGAHNTRLSFTPKDQPEREYCTCTCVTLPAPLRQDIRLAHHDIEQARGHGIDCEAASKQTRARTPPWRGAPPATKTASRAAVPGYRP